MALQNITLIVFQLAFSKLTLPKSTPSNTSELVTSSALTAGGHHSKVSYARFLVRAHRSEIMFGVLVVILCPDDIADLGFSTGERQIPFIVSLRVLGALRLGASGTRCPPLRACSK